MKFLFLSLCTAAALSIMQANALIEPYPNLNELVGFYQKTSNNVMKEYYRNVSPGYRTNEVQLRAIVDNTAATSFVVKHLYLHNLDVDDCQVTIPFQYTGDDNFDADDVYLQIDSTVKFKNVLSENSCFRDGDTVVFGASVQTTTYESNSMLFLYRFIISDWNPEGYYTSHVVFKQTPLAWQSKAGFWWNNFQQRIDFTTNAPTTAPTTPAPTLPSFCDFDKKYNYKKLQPTESLYSSGVYPVQVFTGMVADISLELTGLSIPEEINDAEVVIWNFRSSQCKHIVPKSSVTLSRSYGFLSTIRFTRSLIGLTSVKGSCFSVGDSLGMTVEIKGPTGDSCGRFIVPFTFAISSTVTSESFDTVFARFSTSLLTGGHMWYVRLSKVLVDKPTICSAPLYQKTLDTPVSALDINIADKDTIFGVQLSFAKTSTTCSLQPTVQIFGRNPLNFKIPADCTGYVTILRLDYFDYVYCRYATENGAMHQTAIKIDGSSIKRAIVDHIQISIE